MAVMADLWHHDFITAALPYPVGCLLPACEDFLAVPKPGEVAWKPGEKGGNYPAKDGLQPGITAKTGLQKGGRPPA